MKKKTIARLVVYGSSVIACTVFMIGLFTLFGRIRLHLFDLTEYWVIAVFGSIIALICLVNSTVRTGICIGSLVKQIKAEKQITPVNPTLNGVEEGEAAQNPPECAAEKSCGDTAEGEELKAEEEKPLSVDVEAEADKGRVKLSRKERRLKKLLEEDDKPKKADDRLGLVLMAIICVLAVLYGAWTFAPNRICHHNFAYSLTANSIEDDEDIIKSYKFYQDYLGKPYFVFTEGDKSIHVPLQSTAKGSDKVGKYVLYTFYANERYAKILDCAFDNYTDLEVTAYVYYYTADSHISVTHKAVKTRKGTAQVVYDAEGVIYSYKNISSRN